MRILCIGDIHLGRRSARVSQAVLERVGAAAFTPAAAWRRAVEEGLRLGVDAVALAGDVVEQNDDFYEAYSDLRAGVEDLAAAGIAVVGVAGNHDMEVLPQLAGRIPQFVLLGQGGVWDEAILTDPAGWQLRVVGWSFPEPVVATSPLASGPPPRDERPNIGLLHCDRDQTGSRHAPVRSADLAAAPVDAWLLGHIHRPDRLDERPVGYLGSLMGLDPSESGPHGPWLLEIGLDRRVSMRQLPLAPLRWESLAVPVDHVPAPEAVHGEIMRALEELHRQIMGQTHRPQAVGCRIRLIGRTAYRREIAAELDTSDPTELVMERDGVTYFVERWTLAAQPALDLEELARSSDPAGLLARKLLLLQGDPEDPARRALLAEAGNRLAEVSARLSFASLRDEVLDEQQVAAFLEVSALKALDALLAQREASS